MMAAFPWLQVPAGLSCLCLRFSRLFQGGVTAFGDGCRHLTRVEILHGMLTIENSASQDEESKTRNVTLVNKCFGTGVAEL